MTGNEFEKYFCSLLQEKGYWALNIPKNSSGAQPFDVIAIKRDDIEWKVMAIDCKVCSRGIFQLSRVEDNQWLAFETFSRKIGYEYYNGMGSVFIGIMAYYNEKVYFLPYWYLVDCKDCGRSSIKLSEYEMELNLK